MTRRWGTWTARGYPRPLPVRPAAQYDLVVNAMVLDAWDRRDMTEASGQVTENPAFRRLLNQLKLTEGMVSDSDTDA